MIFKKIKYLAINDVLNTFRLVIDFKKIELIKPILDRLNETNDYGLNFEIDSVAN